MEINLEYSPPETNKVGGGNSLLRERQTNPIPKVPRKHHFRPPWGYVVVQRFQFGFNSIDSFFPALLILCWKALQV